MSTFRKTVVRSFSGAFYVASILGTLLLWTEAYYVVMGIYGLLVLTEFIRLRNGFAWPGVSVSYRPVALAAIAFLWVVLPFTIMSTQPIWVGAVSGETSPGLLMTALFVLVWMHDSFAYLTGILLGKHLLAPTISPKKTIEGSVGGVLFTLLAVMLIWRHPMNSHPLHFWLIGAVLVSMWATLGDLAQSKLKRAAGVKDSGSLMPGHGGFFDRFDALLFTAPVWLIWLWLFR